MSATNIPSLKSHLQAFMPGNGANVDGKMLDTFLAGVADFHARYSSTFVPESAGLKRGSTSKSTARSVTQMVTSFTGKKVIPHLKDKFNGLLFKYPLVFNTATMIADNAAKSSKDAYEACSQNMVDEEFTHLDDWLNRLKEVAPSVTQFQYGNKCSWFFSTDPQFKVELKQLVDEYNQHLQQSESSGSGGTSSGTGKTVGSSGNGKKALHHLISRVGKAAKSLGKIDQLQENLGATDTKLLNIKQAFKAHSHDGKDYKSILGQFLPRLEGCDDDETLDAWFQENYDEVVGAFGLGGSSGLVAPVPVNRKPRGTKTTKSEPVASHVPVRRRRTPAPVVEPVQKATTEDTCDDDDALSIPSLEDVDVDFELDDD